MKRQHIYRYLIVPLFLLGILYLLGDFAGVFNEGSSGSVALHRVRTDTTVSVALTRFGSIVPDDKRVGGQFWVRAKGFIDQPTEVRFVDHERHYEPHVCVLPQGAIDTCWGGDFYTSGATIRFRHNQARSGHLTLDYTFSYPPATWPKR